MKNPARTEFLTGILSTAAEGGINYWAGVGAYKWDGPATLRRIELVELEEDPNDPKHQHTVTLDTIERGLGLLRQVAPAKKDLFLADQTDGQCGDFDAADADAIVQVALFGELVYG